MEVGPTTHYIMGGVQVDADTQMSSVPGLFAAGECAAGINGANRLGGNSLSDLLVFGKRAGEFAAKFAQGKSLGAIDPATSEKAGARKRSGPLNMRHGRKSLHGATRFAGNDARPRRHRARRERNAGGARTLESILGTRPHASA